MRRHKLKCSQCDYAVCKKRSIYMLTRMYEELHEITRQELK